LRAFFNFSYKKEESYYSGIDYLASIISIFVNIMKEEEDSFWSLIQLMKHYHFEKLYKKNFSCLMKLSSLFLNEVKTHFPIFPLKLEEKNIENFCIVWFLTLFSKVIPSVSLVARIWDCFLNEGWEVLIRIGLAIIKLSENYLIAKDISNISVFLSIPPFIFENQNQNLFIEALSFELDSKIKEQLSNLLTE
jgi:hypothetical protein